MLVSELVLGAEASGAGTLLAGKVSARLDFCVSRCCCNVGALTAVGFFLLISVCANFFFCSSLSF